LPGAADLLAGHQVGVLEDSNVLFQTRQGHIKGRRKLADRRWSAPEAVENLTPLGIGKRREAFV
jgi:hypothetical protein